MVVALHNVSRLGQGSVHADLLMQASLHLQVRQRIQRMNINDSKLS